MRVATAVLLAAALAGCGITRLFSGGEQIAVREVGRSLYCGTATEAAQAALLPDLDAVLEWQSARGVTLAPPEALARAPYAIVEMGVRPTGGYGIAVSRAAVLRGESLVLRATFVSPAPGTIRTQALSTPCALVQLPPGRYLTLEVEDQNGVVRASGGIGMPAIPTPPLGVPQDDAPIGPDSN